MRRKKQQSPPLPQPLETVSEEAPRFCPNCGSANPSGGLRCTICGHQFASSSEVASFWSGPGQISDQPGADSPDENYDRWAPDIPSQPDDDALSLYETRPHEPIADPWSSAAGQLAPGTATAESLTAPHRKNRSKTGPPGWLLGCFGLLLIGAVAVAAAILLARPLIADRIEESSSDAITEAIGGVVLPNLIPGTVVFREQDINRSLRANAEEYDPLESPRIRIRRSGFVATFTIYGVESTLTGDLKVRNGRIVIVDPKLDGVADRLLEVDDIALETEAALNDLLVRNNLRPIAITLADDTITITTEPAV